MIQLYIQMAEQVILVSTFSQNCILPSAPKLPPKSLWGNRNRLISMRNKSVISRGRVQMCLADDTEQEILRPLAQFPSSVWKDTSNCLFASTASRICDFDQTYGKQLEELKDTVKEMLITPTNDPTMKISLINSLCRLGVSYHFEAEIEDQLNHIFESQSNLDNIDNNYDLYTIALQFRVFRQHGYKMTSGVFNKFKDSDGKFNEVLKNDAKGMLSLYEATHLRIHGEDILEEALAFTKTHLKSSLASPHLAKHITEALEIPFHKGIPRLEALHYISFYEQDDSRDDTLLLLAKLDFNRLQLLYQQEIRHVTRWWNDSNMASELSYARDRIMEIYFWIVAVHFEPCYSRGRLIFTKFLKIMSIIDDTYDAYGTLQELRCFTNAVERWDTSALNELPEYMKILYSALLNLFEEVNNDASKEGRSYSVSCATEMVKEMVRAYHAEAEWFNRSYMPTFDEYLSNGIISSGCFAITAITFVGMGEIAGMKAFEWLQNRPRIVRSTSIVARVTDDIMTNEFEQQRAHLASSAECYMKQNGVSKQEAVEKLKIMVEDAWKDINEECLKPTAISMQLLIPIVNIPRLIEVSYKDIDAYTNPKYLKHHIYQLFIDPIPI